MRRSLLFASLACVGLVTASPRAAHAQPTPFERPGVPAQPLELPPAPDVDDPMLKPVPRPRVEVATWEQALRHLRARSTDLAIAASEVARAAGQSRVALAGALTTINGTAQYTHNILTNETVQFVRAPDGTFTTRPVNTPFPDFVTGSLTAAQPIFAPRAWYAIGTAERAEDVARLTLEDTKRLISLNAANAIVAVVTAERVAELNRIGLLNALRRLELTQRRTTLGGGTGLDVVRARQDVEVTRANLVAGDETLRKARESLGLALGIPEQVGVPPNVNLDGLEASAVASCRRVKSVDDRPDVASLRANADVARRLVNDVKYQFSPVIDVRSGLNTTTIDTGAAPNTTWNVQAVLTVPIWDGGARYGNLRSNQAQETAALQRVEAQRRKALIEVAQARRGVAVAEDRRRVALTARDLAAETDRLTRTSYLEGRGTSLELVTAAQALREAETQLALRDFELVNARVLAVLALAACPW